ncbi:MAG: glycosyltransferase family 4 protein [Ignavibacteriales bacterium]|nr:glycosyltransferase family 4 protein [Ignavibacteriales bacterium]
MIPSKIKILMFIDEAKMGGGQQHLLWLVQKLDKSKFEVEVVCEHEGYLVDELRKINIKVHPIKISNRPSIPLLIKTYRILKKNSPTILHTHGGTAGFYGRIATVFIPKCVVIHTYHGIHYLNFGQSLLKKIYKSIDKFLLRFTDCTICVAQNDFDIGLKVGIVKKEKAVVIHNGIEVDKFSHYNGNINNKIKLKTEKDTVIIGSVGRLHYQKGYEYLIEASKNVLKSYPYVKFVLIGDGELRNSLESLAKKNGVYNYFTFWGNQTNIPELLAQIDIFVLPSLWEGLPLVLLEAMAAKKPIVATEVNGIVEIIESGKEGLLVPPKNSTAISLALIRLLEDNELCKVLASNAYEKVARDFNISKMINETENLYLKLLMKKENA